MFKKNNLEYLLSGLLVMSTLLSVSMGIATWLQSKNVPMVVYIGMGLAGALQGGVFFLLRKRFFKPLKSVIQQTRQLAGEKDSQEQSSQDRVALLSEFINHIATDVQEATNFAVSIGNGQLDSHFKNAHGNKLTLALEEMRDKLGTIAEQEKKRVWHVNGISSFNEWLRQHLDNPDAFYLNIIKHLVQHLQCTQGGLYLLHEEEGTPYLELGACYAYERRKHLKQRIMAGEGLLGQCMREKETIFLTDIPDDYLTITSGLGKANPRCILMVPLKVNDQLQGVLEVASFQVMEPFQVTFVETLSENIAATLANFKTNKGITRLLSDSQQLNDQLREQENVTQRHMEELQRAQVELQENVEMMQRSQKEMLQKQVELTALFNSVNTTLATLEFDTEGAIFHANDRFLALLGYRLEQIQGQHHGLLFDKSYTASEAYAQFWQQLLANQAISDDFKVVTSSHSERWLNATYTPALDTQGNIYKIIMLAQDITERKKEQLEIQKLSMVADNTNSAVVITDAKGRIEFVNRGFTQTTGYTLEECLEKKPGNFLQGPDTNQETVNRIREAIKAQQPIYDEILNYNKAGESYWISLSINPVFDEEGRLNQFISIQANITQTKKDALDYQCKLNAISESNAIVEFDMDGHILDANANFLAIVGYNKGDLLGKHHRIFLHPSERNSEEYLVFWQMLQHGETIRDEFKRINKYGKEVWLRGTYNPIFDLNGKPYKIVKFAVDMTNEKSLALATRKQERQLQEYLKAINLTIASVEFDLHGEILEVNQIFLGVTGYSYDDLIGQHESVLFSNEELLKPQHEMLWSNLKEGKFFEGEFKLRDKSGKDLWLKGTYNPIFDLNGSLVKITMLAQFTTDEKEKQIELNGVVNALKNATWVLELNPDGTFRNASPKLLDLLGYKRLELRNRTLVSLLAPGAEKETYASVLLKLAGGEMFETELALLTSMGTTGPLKAHFTPLANLEGRIHKIMAVLTAP